MGKMQVPDGAVIVYLIRSVIHHDRGLLFNKFGHHFNR